MYLNVQKTLDAGAVGLQNGEVRLPIKKGRPEGRPVGGGRGIRTPEARWGRRAQLSRTPTGLEIRSFKPLSHPSTVLWGQLSYTHHKDASLVQKRGVLRLYTNGGAESSCDTICCVTAQHVVAYPVSAIDR